MQYVRIMTISGKGPAAEQFSAALRGICVEGDRLYAAGDREVKAFDLGGRLAGRWAVGGPPYCVAVEAGPGGAVWVGRSGRVERFDRQGKPLPAFEDAGRLGTVTAIGFAGDAVLLGDATARCIRRYGRAGEFRNDIGRDNNTQGFVIPNGALDFRVDGEGTIHAVNPGKHRVERYDLQGRMVGRFGRFGMQRVEDFGGCCNPTNLDLLSGGTLVVTEKAAPRLKAYAADGTVSWHVEGDIFDPQCRNMDIAVDRHGRVYVADTERLCILVFGPAGGGAASTPAPASGPGGGPGEVRP
jgi:sugar lactone lactonase YvrE